jgi:hypothetical protein
LSETVRVPAGLTLAGALFALLPPEPSGSTLEEISEASAIAER